MKNDNGKRKIIKDRKLPDSEQINKHQNFDRVHKDYSVVQRIMIKKIIAWAGAVVCTAGIVGLVYMNNSSDTHAGNTIETTDTPKKEACVQPPLPGKEMPYTVYRISATNGGVINYPSGSSITIPANAFHTANGEPIGDSIDIKYREFHTPLDIFLSGIPMDYDSAGVERTLESAGMIEIRANYKGNELVLNSEKPIAIKMASYNNEERFNLYELDTTAQNWIYKGKDKIEEPFKESTVRHMEKQEAEVPTEDNSVKPAMADPQKFSFNINYTKTDFPELAAYDNVLFEVVDNNFKPSFYKINWKKIALYSSDTPGRYIVKLSKADTTILVNATPVFEKGNYEAALQKFEARHKAAAKERDTKEAERQTAVNEVNKGLAGYNSRNINNTAYNLARLTYRLFAVRTTGYHNIDWPLPPVVSYAYNIKRINDQQKANDKAAGKNYSTIFLVEKGKNTVFRFSKGQPIRCNPDAKNLMWTINEKNQIAFFRIADYRKLINGGDNKIEPVVAPSQDLALQELKKFSE